MLDDAGVRNVQDIDNAPSQLCYMRRRAFDIGNTDTPCEYLSLWLVSMIVCTDNVLAYQTDRAHAAMHFHVSTQMASMRFCGFCVVGIEW